MEGLRNCPVCGHEPEVSILVHPKTGQYWYTLACRNPECRWKPHTKKHHSRRDCLEAWEAVCDRMERKVSRHDD